MGQVKRRHQKKIEQFCWYIVEEDKRDVFKCDNCDDEIKWSRNCNQESPQSNFRLQLLNKDILNECPNSYFDYFVFSIYNKYSSQKVMQSLGLLTEVNELIAIELEAFTVIEIESQKAERLYSEKKADKDKKKTPSKRK